jgi:hypothetical protein
MMNAGSFKKGEKRPNQGKRGPGKVTKQARAALAAVIDGNSDRLQGWLGAIATKEGESAAWRAYVSLPEYVTPKMGRTELTSEDGPTEIHFSWGPVKRPDGDSAPESTQAPE